VFQYQLKIFQILHFYGAALEKAEYMQRLLSNSAIHPCRKYL